jgi:protein-L-isoaspartate(D-aspartate) O-methyltransferase
MTLDDWRRFYAEEIRVLANLSSSALVEALAQVPRERFFGSGPWQIASPEQAAVTTGRISSVYVTTHDPRDLCHNALIAIDSARFLNNGQPSAVARWIDALDLKTGDRAFHVGCGVGYYTAILAELVGPEGSVVAVELDHDIAARAKENLSSYATVTVHCSDAAELDPGPCDAMLINAGVTHPHGTWLDRLAEGGRLVLPLTAALGTSSFGSGMMVKIVRGRQGFAARVVSPVMIYSCTSVRDPQLEVALGKALAARKLLEVKSLRLDAHEEGDRCLLHSAKMCLSACEGES